MTDTIFYINSSFFTNFTEYSSNYDNLEVFLFSIGIMSILCCVIILCTLFFREKELTSRKSTIDSMSSYNSSVINNTSSIDASINASIDASSILNDENDSDDYTDTDSIVPVADLPKTDSDDEKTENELDLSLLIKNKNNNKFFCLSLFTTVEKMVDGVNQKIILPGEDNVNQKILTDKEISLYNDVKNIHKKYMNEMYEFNYDMRNFNESGNQHYFFAGERGSSKFSFNELILNVKSICPSIFPNIKKFFSSQEYNQTHSISIILFRPSGRRIMWIVVSRTIKDNYRSSTFYYSENSSIFS
jgi:hypothetical protein